MCKPVIQDGPLCHASKSIEALMMQQSFQVIDWPGQVLI
jgi:hypothetical protein